MILLHCPPTPVYQRDDIFGELERQKKAAQVAANVKAAELPPPRRRADAGGHGDL